MSIIEDLDKTLNGILYQFGQDNTIAVAFENVDQSTDTSIPYLSSFNLPAPVEQADLSVSEFRVGVYQINVHFASHLGKPVLNRMADALNAVFKTGATFTFGTICLQVTSFSPEPLQIEGGWATLPCSVNWETYTTRL